MAAALGAFGAFPDLVVSGINAGINTGHSVIHSGTVGAVLTGRTFGSHGLAVSLASSDPWHWETAVESAVQATGWLVRQRGARLALNVNVPGLAVQDLRGVRWADLDNFGVFRVATANYEDGRLQFEVGGSQAGLDPTSDTALCRDGYVTITPLSPIEPAPFPPVPAGEIILLGENQAGES
jgi:5'-nucleotidase